MESGDRLLRGFRFSHNLQIGVALDDGNNTLSDDWMVIDTKNRDSLVVRQFH